MNRRTHSRRINPHAYDPLEHNRVVARRKRFRRFVHKAEGDLGRIAEAFLRLAVAMRRAQDKSWHDQQYVLAGFYGRQNGKTAAINALKETEL